MFTIRRQVHENKRFDSDRAVRGADRRGGLSSGAHPHLVLHPPGLFLLSGGGAARTEVRRAFPAGLYSARPGRAAHLYHRRGIGRPGAAHRRLHPGAGSAGRRVGRACAAMGRRLLGHLRRLSGRRSPVLCHRPALYAPGTDPLPPEAADGVADGVGRNAHLPPLGLPENCGLRAGWQAAAALKAARGCAAAESGWPAQPPCRRRPERFARSDTPRRWPARPGPPPRRDIRPQTRRWRR